METWRRKRMAAADIRHPRREAKEIKVEITPEETKEEEARRRRRRRRLQLTAIDEAEEEQ